MANKNTNLGGEDWSTGQHLQSVDVNDTFDALYSFATAWQ